MWLELLTDILIFTETKSWTLPSGIVINACKEDANDLINNGYAKRVDKIKIDGTEFNFSEETLAYVAVDENQETQT